MIVYLTISSILAFASLSSYWILLTPPSSAILSLVSLFLSHFFTSIYYVFTVLGMEPRASYMQGNNLLLSYTLPTQLVIFIQNLFSRVYYESCIHMSFILPLQVGHPPGNP